RRRATGLVLMGKARDAIASQLGEPVPTRKVQTMQEAVSAARELASPGEGVLLAPACASFDAYRNFEERGEDFKRRVAALARRADHPRGARRCPATPPSAGFSSAS